MNRAFAFQIAHESQLPCGVTLLLPKKKAAESTAAVTKRTRLQLVVSTPSSIARDVSSAVGLSEVGFGAGTSRRQVGASPPLASAASSATVHKAVSMVASADVDLTGNQRSSHQSADDKPMPNAHAMRPQMAMPCCQTADRRRQRSIVRLGRARPKASYITGPSAEYTHAVIRAHDCDKS